LLCRPLTEELADLLIARTMDPADGLLREMTHDLSRFSSLAQLDRWRERDREALCLCDATGSLLGIFWVAEKPLPARDDYYKPVLIRTHDPRLTVAIRLYGPARGRGLAKDFSAHALAEFLGHYPEPPALWFETRADNLVTRSLGKRMGFVEATAESGGTVIGVRFAGKGL
jgi:hypothetical protein